MALTSFSASEIHHHVLSVHVPFYGDLRTAYVGMYSLCKSVERIVSYIQARTVHTSIMAPALLSLDFVQTQRPTNLLPACFYQHPSTKRPSTKRPSTKRPSTFY